MPSAREADRMRREPPGGALVDAGEAALLTDRLLEEVEDHSIDQRRPGR